MQRQRRLGALVNKNRCNWSTTYVELGFQHNAFGATSWVGGELFNFGQDTQLLEQVVNSEATLCSHLDNNCFSAPCFWGELIFCELRKHSLHICIVFVNFIDSNHNWNLGSASMANGFNRLWHDTIVRSHHQHNDVGDLCTTCAHLGKCSVTWCVDKGN
jgi:hypothetical protein